MTDSFVGSLTFVRVYSGVLSAGTYVMNANKGKKERIGRLLEMHANSREDVKTARTGDIVALAGLKVRRHCMWCSCIFLHAPSVLHGYQVGVVLLNRQADDEC